MEHKQEFFRLFTDSTDEFPIIKESINAARSYAMLMVKCASIPVSTRIEIQNHWGWQDKNDAPVIQDMVHFEQFNRERALKLFPMAAERIKANHGNLDLSEVQRAEDFFIKATRLAPGVLPFSSDELMSFLTQIIPYTIEKEAGDLSQDTKET